MIRAKVFLKNRQDGAAELFDYDFVGEPRVGDEIHEGEKVYTLLSRFWMGGKFCLYVTDLPTSGVIQC